MDIINNYNKSIKKLNSIYIGYDVREHIAYEVLHHSINKLSKNTINILTLNLLNLRRIGLYRRAPSIKSTCWGNSENMIDCFDNKPFSTDFSFSRFLTPILNQYEGYAIFMDSDMYFRSDPSVLFEFAKQKNQKQYAIWCVKHKYKTNEKNKMYGCPQTNYNRKNWSSFILWNCSHPSNLNLTVDDVNTKSGSWLHQFKWLKDEEIGSLPEEWNFLDGHSNESINPKNVHFTTGGPWFKNWKPKREIDEKYSLEWINLKKKL
jgi:hypothetical protein